MTKVYDRNKKEWITEEEHNKRYTRRDKDLCKGKRPHDWVLTLPSWGVKTDERYNFNPAPYYKALLAIDMFYEKQRAILEMSGILIQKSYSGWGIRRRYICAVCKKQKYGE